jgi:hypothetical protein
VAGSNCQRWRPVDRPLRDGALMERVSGEGQSPDRATHPCPRPIARPTYASPLTAPPTSVHDGITSPAKGGPLTAPLTRVGDMITRLTYVSPDRVAHQRPRRDHVSGERQSPDRAAHPHRQLDHAPALRQSLTAAHPRRRHDHAPHVRQP